MRPIRPLRTGLGDEGLDGTPAALMAAMSLCAFAGVPSSLAMTPGRIPAYALATAAARLGLRSVTVMSRNGSFPLAVATTAGPPSPPTPGILAATVSAAFTAGAVVTICE